MLHRLGEGGMGTVYLCEHVLLRRRVAVKVLKPELARDPELVERFRNEAIAASQIGSEHVVDVIDLGRTDDGAFFYAMEALDGRSLGAILRDEGPLDVGRALGLVAQVCRALSAAHARGVVHRDLKPENVFVVVGEDGAERAKVLDFGISRVDAFGTGERLTRAGAIIGTPEYMAPEQASGAAVDHRADVYALGVLLYEVLTGALPLAGDTALATLVAHQSRPPEPPSAKRPGLPGEVDAVVLRALAKRPEDRWPSMDAFAAELLRVRARGGAAGTPGPIRATEVIAAPTPAARAWRGRVAVLGGGAAVVLGVAAWWGVGARGAGVEKPTASASASASTSTSPSPSASAAGERGSREADRGSPIAATNSAQTSNSNSNPHSNPNPNPRKHRAPHPSAGDPYSVPTVLKPDPFE